MKPQLKFLLIDLLFIIAYFLVWIWQQLDSRWKYKFRRKIITH